MNTVDNLIAKLAPSESGPVAKRRPKTRTTPETAAEIVASSNGEVKSAGFQVIGTTTSAVGGRKVITQEIYAEFDNQTDSYKFLEQYKELLPADAKVIVWSNFI